MVKIYVKGVQGEDYEIINTDMEPGFEGEEVRKKDLLDNLVDIISSPSCVKLMAIVGWMAVFFLYYLWLHPGMRYYLF